MSIITDTLNRLQSHQTQKAANSVSSLSSGAPGRRMQLVWSRNGNSSGSRKIWRLLLGGFLLFGFGIGAYWLVGTLILNVPAALPVQIPSQGNPPLMKPNAAQSENPSVDTSASSVSPIKDIPPPRDEMAPIKGESSENNIFPTQEPVVKMSENDEGTYREKRAGFASLAPPSSPTPRPKPKMTPGQSLAQVRELIARQQYHQALLALGPLIQVHPGQWEFWFWMGTAQLGLGELEHAEQSLMEGLAINGTVPHLWIQRALVAQQQNDYDKAIQALRQAEILASDLPDVPLNLAYSLDAQGLTRPAIRHYRRFLALTEGMLTHLAVRKKVLRRLLVLEPLVSTR